MDWTSHFEDEDDGLSTICEWTRAGRCAEKVKKEGYGAFVTYAFTLNYILGVGALGIPRGFAKAGIILGSGIVILVSFFSMLTIHWVVEAWSRGLAVIKAGHHERRPSEATMRPTQHQPLLCHSGSFSDTPEFGLENGKLEVVRLCEIFLGKKGKYSYQFALSCLMYTGLWAYATVFSASLASQFPIWGTHNEPEEGTYRLYTAIYGLIVIPMSCFELTEQVKVQVALTVARFVTFGAIVLCCAVYMNEDIDGHDVPKNEPVKLVDFGNFGVLFGTAVFSQLFQHSVPGLAQPLRKKSKLRSIFNSALATTASLYILMGCVCAAYFKSATMESINLNWRTLGSDSPRPLWDQIVSWVIVLFPTIETISVFPLIAITLGNNILVVFPHSRLPAKWFRLTCRLLASAPPIVGALLIRNLEIILQISGIFGVYIAFMTPALLQRAARLQCIAAWGPKGEKTPYTWHFSHQYYVAIVFGFSCLAVVLVFLNVVAPDLLVREDTIG